MKRAQFVSIATAVLVLPSVVLAQRPTRLPTIGVLTPGAVATAEQIALSPATRMMAEPGWIEGKTVLTERVSNAGPIARFRELAEQLVSKRVDVIMAFGDPAAVAAARATNTIPIVFARVTTPIELGLAKSLAHPGGNVTGVTTTAGDQVYAKPFEFLRDIRPDLKFAAALVDDATGLTNVVGESMRLQTKAIAEGVALVARHTGIETRPHLIRSPEDLNKSLTAIAEDRSQALYVGNSALIFQQRHKIVDFALRQHLPSLFVDSSFVDAGGMLSYGSDAWATLKQSIWQVDRILRGAKPGDMPIEQPTRFDLVINLTTARELGLKIPPSVLVRADRVVQ